MHIGDTAEEAAFRAEARAWLASQATERSGGAAPDPHHDLAAHIAACRSWQATLAEHGWAGVTWPAAFGGRGGSAIEAAIFAEEQARFEVSTGAFAVAIGMVGPTLIAHGTPAQQERFLGPMLRGEHVWCQLFSEPGAGSDLASLGTRAERRGDRWVVNGQKVWTSSGHLAQKCMLLTRTHPDAPKHKGITYLLADTKDFDIRPLVMVNHDAEFNEMFISDAFVDDFDLLGTPGEGWRYALSTLGFERGTIGFNLQVWARRAVDQLNRVVADLGLADDDAVLEQIGRFEADVEAIRVTGIRSMASVAEGSAPGPESSILKILWARTVQNINRYSIEVQTAGGVLIDDGRAADVVHHYLRSRGHSIEGGSDEIMKSIIAERVLGLPKSR